MSTPEVTERTLPAVRSVAPALALDVQTLISQAIERGTDVDTMERLFALAKDMRAVQAKEAYNWALSRFQAECPPIYKTRDGQVGNAPVKYASLAEIMPVIRPVLAKYGLAATWRSPRSEAGKVIRVCRVSHEMGHEEESGEVVIPIGSHGAATPAQQVGLATTYADRYALRDVLGLAPLPEEQDTDGAAPPGRGQEPPEPEDQVTTISESDQRRCWATLRSSGWGQTKEEQETAMHDLLAKRQVNHLRDLPARDLQAFVLEIKAGPKR